MRAVIFNGVGGPEVIQEVTRPAPVLGPECLRIAIKAFSLNRADLLQRRGKYPPPPGESDVPGLEASGTILETSPQSPFQKGDRVMTLLGSGGYADEVVVPTGLVMPLPDSLTFAQGAAVPEAFLTAHHNLFTLGKLLERNSVLIHAGASGVGTSGIQLARLSGKITFCTVGNDDKKHFCERLGAQAINYKTSVFSDTFRNCPVDLILDCIGADYFEQNCASLNTGGAIVFIGTMGGAETKLNLGLMLKKRLSLIGSTLRSLPLPEKIAVVKRFWEQFGPALQSGKLKPIVDSTFPVSQLKEAHTRMESNLNTGKIVIEW